MKRMARWIALLYPASWRERYGDEMDALLEDVEARPGHTWDLLRGALLMRISRASFKNAACICAAMGALIAIGIAINAPREYVSSAVVSLGAKDGTPEALEGLQRAQLRTLSTQSLSELVTVYGLYPDKQHRYHMGITLSEMRNRDIRIAPLDATRKTVTVQFRYPDPLRAQAATQYLVQRLIRETASNGRPAVAMEILEPPTLSVSPAWSRRITIILAGLAAGFGIGLLLMGIRRWPFVAVTAAACAVLAAGISYYVSPDQYVSSAVLRFNSATNSEAILKGALNDESLNAMIRKMRLANEPPASFIAHLRNHDIRIADVVPSETSRTVRVQFMYPDRYKAQMGLHALTSAMIAPRELAAVEVIDYASLPEIPAAPQQRIAIACAGCGLGIVIGALLMRWRKQQQTAAA